MTLERLLIEGERACFRRQEFVEDLVTYDVITPAAVERMLAIMSPKRLIVATSVTVLKPLTKSWFSITTNRGSRRCHALNDVAYVIEIDGGHPSELEAAIRDNRFHLGLSDLPASVRRLDGSAPPSAFAGDGMRDLGWLPYSYGNSSPRRLSYVQVAMVNGVIDLNGAAERPIAR